jgi:hypothetical protein
MSDDKFSVEESAALLHAIFPNYPDILGMRPAPEVGAFLRTLRAESRGKRAQSAVIPTIEPASNTFPITCTNELFGGE